MTTLFPWYIRPQTQIPKDALICTAWWNPWIVVILCQIQYAVSAKPCQAARYIQLHLAGCFFSSGGWNRWLWKLLRNTCSVCCWQLVSGWQSWRPTRGASTTYAEPRLELCQWVYVCQQRQKCMLGVAWNWLQQSWLHYSTISINAAAAQSRLDIAAYRSAGTQIKWQSCTSSWHLALTPLSSDPTDNDEFGNSSGINRKGGTSNVHDKSEYRNWDKF